MRACTWNLHGKHLEELGLLWQDLVVTPDVLFLQEVGGQLNLETGVSKSTLWLAGEEFVLHVINLIDSEKANRAQGILFKASLASLDLQVLSSVPLPTGLMLHAKHSLGSFHLASFHLLHSNRSDVEQVWQDKTLARVSRLSSHA